MITLLAAFLAIVTGHQQNPNGSPSLPTQIAVYNTSGSTGTIVMEVRDNTGRQVVWTDTNGTIYPSASLSIGSHVALGLGWQATNTMPDSVHALKSLANGPQYTAILYVSSGTFTLNSAGTYDATVGSGNGIAVGVAAPSASSPTTLVTGSTYVVAAGGQVTPIGSAAVTVAGGATASNQATMISLLGGGLPSVLATDAIKTSSMAYFTTYSTGGEGTTTVTATPGTLTVSGGGDPSGATSFVVDNQGTLDIWVAPISGNHTWRCPAKQSTVCPFSWATVYCLVDLTTSGGLGVSSVVTSTRIGR